MVLTEKEINKDYYKIEGSDCKEVTLENSAIKKLEVNLENLSELSLKNCKIEHLIIQNGNELNISCETKINTLEINTSNIDRVFSFFDKLIFNSNKKIDKYLILHTSYSSYYKNRSKIQKFFSKVSLSYLDRDVEIDGSLVFDLHLDRRHYFIQDLREECDFINIYTKGSKLEGKLKGDIRIHGLANLIDFKVSRDSKIRLSNYNEAIPAQLLDNIVSVQDSYTNFSDFKNLRSVCMYNLSEDLIIPKKLSSVSIYYLKGSVSLNSKDVSIKESFINNFEIKTDNLQVDMETLNSIESLGNLDIKKIEILDSEEEFCYNPIMKEFCKKYNIPFVEKNQLSTSI